LGKQVGFFRFTYKNCQLAENFAQRETPSFLQENVDVPVVSVSAKDITLNTLFEMVEANQFLQLPRLSSQDIFDQLCPGMIHRYLRKVYYSSYVSWEKIHMEEQVLVTGTKQSRQGSLPC
jgi:hypothetical protein